MRRLATHRRVWLLVMLTTAICACVLMPVTAMAADGADASSVAVADERLAWARSQTSVETHALDAEQGDASLACVRYYQRFVSEYTGVERTFEYRLVALDANAPMPKGSQDGLYAWTFTGNDAGWINADCGDVDVSQGERVFSYLAFQHITEKKAGYTYDDSVYFVQVHVFPDGRQPVAIVYDSTELSNKVDDPGWTVRYKQPKSPEQEGTTKAPEDSPKQSQVKDRGQDTISPEAPLDGYLGKDHQDHRASTDEEVAKTSSGTYQSSYVPSSSAKALAKTGDATSRTASATFAASLLLLAAAALLRYRDGGEPHA